MHESEVRFRFPGLGTWIMTWGWRKLHLAVDEAGRVLAAELTDNDVADASVLSTLLSRRYEDRHHNQPRRTTMSQPVRNVLIRAR